jgi:phosphatidylserine decarboxylase
MWELIKTSPQYILPQHFLSACMYRATRWRCARWKNFVIRKFIHHYKVDMEITERPDPESYVSFNDFFTRSLQTTARPIHDSPVTIASPVDGSVSQAGKISGNTLLQAKGKNFNLDTLLARDLETVKRFTNGSFSTIYLSPRDYHRIHMPANAKLLKMTYIPGDLFSVNDSTSQVVDNLFARNERLVCVFDTEFGLMAVILVGAIFVGGMETVWQGEITPAKTREVRIWNYEENSVEQTKFKKGDELGRFNMGSTVILLFEKDRINWSETMDVGNKVKLGQPIATANNSQ